MFLSMGIFCVALSLCMGFFLLFRRKNTLKSPLAVIRMVTSQIASGDTSQVQHLCSKYNLSCNNIEEDGDTVTFHLNNSTIYISTTKDMEKEIGSLQLTIRELTMEGKEFHRLDFRFDRPVISK